MLINPIASILNREVSKSKLNILLFTTDPYFEVELCKTGHNFYSSGGNYETIWPKDLPTPSNYYPIPEPVNAPPDLCFDLILIQDKNKQYEIGTYLSQILHLPRIVYNNLYPANFDVSAFQRTGEIDVYCSENMRVKWGGLGAVIDNAAQMGDTNWDNIQPYVLEISPQLGSLIEDLNLKTEGNIYLNVYGPHIQQPIITEMSKGRVVIALDFPEFNQVVEHDKTGYIFKDFRAVPELVKMLIEQPHIAKSIGDAAKEKMKERSQANFLKKWNDVFEDSKNIIYMR